jgi:hypothetical protein
MMELLHLLKHVVHEAKEAAKEIFKDEDDKGRRP